MGAGNLPHSFPPMVAPGSAALLSCMLYTFPSMSFFLNDDTFSFAGYANEVGEAFRVWVSPFWVRLSYGISSAYVLADTYDKGSKAALVRTTGDRIEASCCQGKMLIIFIFILLFILFFIFTKPMESKRHGLWKWHGGMVIGHAILLMMCVCVCCERYCDIGSTVCCCCLCLLV